MKDMSYKCFYSYEKIWWCIKNFVNEKIEIKSVRFIFNKSLNARFVKKMAGRLFATPSFFSSIFTSFKTILIGKGEYFFVMVTLLFSQYVES